MLSSRLFTVVIGDKKSRQRVLNNGLPQGSVLAPLLFNLYTHDIPTTKARKFIYADDICLVTQDKNLEACEKTLTADLTVLSHYLKQWKLKPRATEIGNYGKIPKLWLESKVIAILKPNKDASDPNNYRPISLLSTMYKHFERLLLARLQPIVEKSLPLEQAGFRQNRNCCDQVLAITTHVENGFQQKAKSGALFLDLSSGLEVSF